MKKDRKKTVAAVAAVLLFAALLCVFLNDRFGLFRRAPSQEASVPSFSVSGAASEAPDAVRENGTSEAAEAAPSPPQYGPILREEMLRRIGESVEADSLLWSVTAAEQGVPLLENVPDGVREQAAEDPRLAREYALWQEGASFYDPESYNTALRFVRLHLENRGAEAVRIVPGDLHLVTPFSLRRLYPSADLLYCPEDAVELLPGGQTDLDLYFLGWGTMLIPSLSPTETVAADMAVLTTLDSTKGVLDGFSLVEEANFVPASQSVELESAGYAFSALSCEQIDDLSEFPFAAEQAALLAEDPAFPEENTYLALQVKITALGTERKPISLSGMSVELFVDNAHASSFRIVDYLAPAQNPRETVEDVASYFRYTPQSAEETVTLLARGNDLELSRANRVAWEINPAAASPVYANFPFILLNDLL